MVRDRSAIVSIVKKDSAKLPYEFGEDKILVTMGSLHTEKNLWCASGEFISGSGYPSALASSGVCTSGVAESVINVSSIMRPRFIKQVSVVAIDILKQRAYLKYREIQDKCIAEAEKKIRQNTEHTYFRETCGLHR